MLVMAASFTVVNPRSALSAHLTSRAGLPAMMGNRKIKFAVVFGKPV
jgi:hypothetical protein